MNEKQLARFLIEQVAAANIHKKIAVFVNRLMLRLHSQPALIANLADIVVYKPDIGAETNDQVEDGAFNESLYEADTSDARDRNAPDDENSSHREKKDGKDDDGVTLVQLSFRRLPQEVIAPLLRLIASPREPKMFRFSKDGSARTGIELKLKPSDFPGDDYDYSF